MEDAKGSMKVMGPGGHKVLEYAPSETDLLQEVEDYFDVLIRKGYNAFSIDAENLPTHIEEFDPAAHIVMVPIIAGG